MPASKLAASKKAASKVEHVQHLFATRWLVGVFVKCNLNEVSLIPNLLISFVLLELVASDLSLEQKNTQIPLYLVSYSAS